MFFDLNQSYDLYDHLKDEKGTELINFIQDRVEFPDYVKSAQECEEPIEKLDDTFALIVKEGGQNFRKFQLEDPIDTWFSQQSFIKSAEKLPIICRGIAASNIKKACEYHDIKVDFWVEKMASSVVELFGVPKNMVDFDNEEISIFEADAMSKISFESKFALPSLKKYKLNTISEVKTACDFLKKNLKDFKEDELEEEFSLNLKQACERLLIPVPDLVEDILDNTVKISSEFLKAHFKDRIDSIDPTNKNKAESVKLAYMNISENCEFMKLHELEEAIKEADEKELGLINYFQFMTPSQIVKQAYGSTSYIESDYTYETADPQYLAATKAFDGKAQKDKMGLMEKKVAENPNMFKGYFDRDTLENLKKDFNKTYQEMGSEDRQTIQKVYREVVGESDE